MASGDWFVPFAEPGGDPTSAGFGRPWGLGTAYAARAAHEVVPVDPDCEVVPFVGGYWAMAAIRDAMNACRQAALAAQQRGVPPGQRGLVYVAGWRCNPLRDLSSANAWETSPWMDGTKPYPAADKRDETLLGLLLSLIAAGVRVRVLAWMPTPIETVGIGHAAEHLFLACAVKKASELAKQQLDTTEDLGVVCLDARVAESLLTRGAHHQKMCVVRCADATDPVAFVGGVDLAYTRRDAPMVPSQHQPGEVPPGFYAGDWQSGDNLPGTATAPPMGKTAIADGWPFGDPAMPPWLQPVRQLKPPPRTTDAKTDLFAEVYGATRQKWHDQHLQLKGPVVATIEQQFCERWVDAGFFDVIADDIAASGFLPSEGEAYFTSEQAIAKKDLVDMDDNAVTPLPTPKPVDPIPGATASVQMWRTIPARPRGSANLFKHGEFTVMAGYAHAMNTAKKLIFICDQYFWSVPTTRLLNKRLKDPSAPDLAVVVILPPRADSLTAAVATATNKARAASFTALLDGLTEEQRARVRVFNAWEPATTVEGVTMGNLGVYVHAKSHVYDGELVVCGSANVNRRSMVGDSELAVAVHDPAMAAGHLRALWTLFSGGAGWPTHDGQPYDASQHPGQTLLAALEGAATKNLIIDPQFADPSGTDLILPNEARSSRGTRQMSVVYSVIYNKMMESCSLDVGRIESGDPDLAQVSATTENVALYKRNGRSPYPRLRVELAQPPMVPVMP